MLTIRISIDISKETRAKIEAEAKKEKRLLKNQIEHMLENYFNKKDIVSKVYEKIGIQDHNMNKAMQALGIKTK